MPDRPLACQTVIPDRQARREFGPSCVRAPRAPVTEPAGRNRPFVDDFSQSSGMAGSGQMVQLVLPRVHTIAESAWQSRVAVLDDRLEDGLQLRRRAADDAQEPRWSRSGIQGPPAARACAPGPLRTAERSRSRSPPGPRRSGGERPACRKRVAPRNDGLRSLLLPRSRASEGSPGWFERRAAAPSPVRQGTRQQRLKGRGRAPACDRPRRVPSPSRVRSEEAQSQLQSSRDAPRL